MKTIVATVDLKPGMRVRLFESHEFGEVKDLWPTGKNGVIVTFVDDSTATVGRGAEWEVES